MRSTSPETVRPGSAPRAGLARMRALGRVTARVARRVPLELWVLPLAGLLVYLTYWPAAQGYFLSDDFVWLQGARDATARLGVILELRVCNFFRPIPHLFKAGLYALWGASPLAFHAASFVLHALNATLLARLTLRLVGDRRAAVVAALVFLLLPTYHEAVLWISAVNELLCVLFGLLALLGWLAYLRGSRARRRLLGLTVLCFALALGCKESAPVLLGLMVLLHAWLRYRGEARPGTIPAYALLLAVLAPYLAYQAWIQSGQGFATTGHFALTLRVPWRWISSLGKILADAWPVLVTAPFALLVAGPGRGRLRVGVGAALALIVAFLVVITPYCLLTWGLNPSRYNYLPAVVAALGAALALRGLATAGRPWPRVLALVALVGLVVSTLDEPQRQVELYLSTAHRAERFVARARTLPEPRVEILILDSPLHASALSAAMQLWHPTHSPRFRAVTRTELRAFPVPRWIWRWDPLYEELFELERRLDPVEPSLHARLVEPRGP